MGEYYRGNIIDSMSYTPFGQRRMFSDWSKTDTAKHLIDRGFTGQQHLDNFALINFNGRMYDPVLAHFLSPDPYIQSPENPLNYNRYAYCLFSPLQYVDPSGEMIDWVEGIDGKIYWDPLATSSATIKNGEKYWGKEGYGIDEETGLLVHYQSDGTKNSFIISKKGTIVTGEKISKEHGFSISVGGSFFFGLGIAFEIGYAKDSYGQGSLYGTGSLGTGIELGIGINYSKIPKETTLQQFADPGGFGSINVSIPFISGNISENMNWQNIGLSFGPIKSGFSVRANRTILLDPISGSEKADYYSRFGHIKR